MSLRHSTRTPVRALTLAEMGMTTSRTKQKPKPIVTLRPTSQAKRLVDMYQDIFPSTVRRHQERGGLIVRKRTGVEYEGPGNGEECPEIKNTTSVKKILKPANSIQKTYLSTSKKQIQTRKTDHTIVRRALNFIATNQIEEIQVHPKSKKIMRHTIAPVRQNNEKSNPQDLPKSVHSTPVINNKSKGVFRKPQLNDSTHNNDRRSTATHSNRHTYDLRTRQTVSDSSDKISIQNIHTFTQYRNVNESFDVSINEEPSPGTNVVEKSVIEPLEKSQWNVVDSQLSDLLCDMLCKTELTSNNSNITQKIKHIHEKIQENIQNANKQMKFMSMISDEISKNNVVILSYMESNKQILEMTNDLLKLVNDNEIVEKPAKTNKLTGIPVSRRSIVKPFVYKFSQESTSNSVANNVVSPFKNSEDKVLYPITANMSQYNNVLRDENKPKILSHDVKNSAIKENVSPLRKKTYSPKKITSSPRSNQRKSKSNNLRTAVLKSEFESNKNVLTMDEGSPSKHSKSQLMFKSLKNSVKFLKTPVGKGKTNVSSNVAFETPNTRSRNITSNNIKRQLESLYDS